MIVMIDRGARDKAAELLEALITRGITNQQLDDEWPTGNLDSGVKAIGEQIWCYYDDFPEKKLMRFDFQSDEIELFERCLAFLKSNQDYQWPAYSFETENMKWHERFLPGSKQRSRVGWEYFIAAGEIAVWPFLHSDER